MSKRMMTHDDTVDSSLDPLFRGVKQLKFVL